MKKIITGIFICLFTIIPLFCSVTTGQNTTAGGNTNENGSTQESGTEGDTQNNMGNSTIENNYGNAGFTINQKCLLNGQCKMNIYKTLGIRKSDQNPTVQTFTQDIVLAATTFFGTLITIMFIISGLLYIFDGYTGKSSANAKKYMIGSIIGLLFVTLSYTIIRLIQFLATGGS